MAVRILDHRRRLLARSVEGFGDGLDLPERDFDDPTVIPIWPGQQEPLCLWPFADGYADMALSVAFSCDPH